jgi:ATP-dependent DNA helicase RecG
MNEAMNIYETFNNLRYQHENEVVEFKRAENNFDFDDLGKYFSALSNEANLREKSFAWLVFGVHDKTREILGTTYKNGMKSLQKLKYDLSQHTTDRNTFRDIYELEVEGKRVLMFQIPAAPRGIPMAWQGHFYARRGESLVALDMNKYEEIRRQTVNVDWTAEIVVDATIEDLDKEAIKKAREGYKQRYPKLANDCDGWDDKVFLDKAGLTIDGKVTRTTLLLVGKETAAHKLNHIAQIVWKCFQDGQVFGDIYTIPFVLTTTELLGRIRNYRFKLYPKNSLIPAEVWKYDTESILEGMHNSIAHQKYEKNARIIVTENMDSLKFQNDGSFYEGNYKEYITGEKTPKSYRNPALVKAMVNIRMIDTQGYGIHKMFQSQKDRYLPMPDYEQSTADEVILNLPGTIIDENYSLMLLANQNMSLTDAVLLDQVQKGMPINDNAIRKLRKDGLIEGRKPHLYVSKQIAKATNTQVEYTLKKGFIDAECQEWIIKALKDHKVLSRKQINELLWNKLPVDFTEEQKLAKIKNLLYKMHKNSVIWLDEERKWHKSKD